MLLEEAEVTWPHSQANPESYLAAVEINGGMRLPLNESLSIVIVYVACTMRHLLDSIAVAKHL